MPSYDPKALPDEVDVDRAYRLALGRSATAAEMECLRLSPMGAWVPGLFATKEFSDLKMRAARRQPISPGGNTSLPMTPLTEWAASFFPLRLPSRVEVAAATTWRDLYLALFSDTRFRRRIARDWTGLKLRSFLAALSFDAVQTPGLIGAVTRWTADEVTGWIIDRRDPDRCPIVELIVDGRFVASAAAVSAEVGSGPRGIDERARRFRLAGPFHVQRGAIAEVREAGPGHIFARLELPDPTAPAESVGELRGELARLRTMLDHIEAKLPEFTHGLGFPIEAWSEYFATYYAPAHRHVIAGTTIVDVAVLIDAISTARLDLGSAMASIAGQGCRPRIVVVIHGGGEPGLDCRAMLLDMSARLDGVRLVEREAIDGSVPATIADVALTLDTANILLMPGACRLAPDCVGLLDAALRNSEADLAYCDSDTIAGEVWEIGRHVRPILRSGPDATLAVQQDAFGDVLMVRRDRLNSLPLQGVAWRDALVLACLLSERETIHISRVLYHRTDRIVDVSLEARLGVVRDHLALVAPGASAGPFDEVQGIEMSNAIRVRYPLARGVRAAIIVPTRDRGDLLAGCLASIEASFGANRTTIEIVIVDNRSGEAETRSLLDRVGRHSAVRILPYDAGFNWAAINNYAASHTDADVLIFLNNDTVALSPGCWDELVAQALRSEVGAAGARLLYADGTIQHAGVVLDQWHSFARHEGVGDDGGNPGYLQRHALAREVAMVTGACLATRATVFREIGGFDAAAFPVEGNDTDYCLRLRAAGYQVVYAGQACLYHFESKSRGHNDDEFKRRRAFEATQVLRARWAERFQHDPYYNAHFDRLAPPFQRLLPPPAGAPVHAGSTDRCG